MHKFRLSADIIFEAEDNIDAFQQLINHFERQQNGKKSEFEYSGLIMFEQDYSEPYSKN